MRRVAPLLVSALLLASVVLAGVRSAAAQDEDPTPTLALEPAVETLPPTQTPTLEPTLEPTAIVESPTPEATEVIETPTDTPEPTPWVVILITPTPQRKPPSLQILDLQSKFKGETFGPNMLGAPVPAPSSQGSSIPIEVDDAIDRFWDWTVARQLEVYAISGQFVQLLPSHTAIPAGGFHAYPDGWYGHPTDRPNSWDSFNAINYEPLPFSIRIDVYDGPAGTGFVACFQMDLGGILERCRNYGGEGIRQHGWQPVEIDV